MTDQPTRLEVTQADIDAAAEYNRRFPELRLTEAFAKHRLAHTVPGDAGLRDTCLHCGSANRKDVKGTDKVHPYRVFCGDCGCGTA